MCIRDSSKVVRMDYAADEQHTAMGELSLRRWREWNAVSYTHLEVYKRQIKRCSGAGVQSFSSFQAVGDRPAFPERAEAR